MALSTQSNKKTKKLSKKKKIVGIVLISIISAVLLIFLLLRFLPYKDLKNFCNERKYSTRIYDCNYNLIQILPLDDGLRREYTPLDKIPENIQQAFITTEDRHFYKHFGVDFSAIFRALFQNASSRETVSGASTITMQLAKIITPRKKRNIGTKIVEAINAFRIELRLSKKEILELYLNNVPFGFNTEGVSSAARTFYSKSLEELTENQIYTLAVVPRSPADYNPLTNPGNCAERAANIFNKEKSDLLKTAELSESYEYPFNMPHYIKYLETQDIGLYGKDDIRLSANLKLQNTAQELLSQYLYAYSDNRISNGAVLVVNTQTGEILTWVGSGDFYNNIDKGQIDGVLAINQPGSSMKPFLYGLAIESGYSPSTVLPDIPTDFGFEELYVPQNFNNRFNGPVRLRMALASSLNVPAVYLLNNLGLKNYTDKLVSAGFYSLKNANPGLGIALGNAEVSLFELVQGFSIFPRDGYFVPLCPFLTSGGSGVSGGAGRAGETDRAGGTEVYSTDTARLICDMLSDNSSRAIGFRNTKAFSTDFPSIFKTGTANQYQNITALAATPLYTVGVWMGNFDGETVVGKTGSSLPAAIAKKLLETIQHEYVDFKKPEHWNKRTICSLSGMAATDKCPHTVEEYVKDTDSAPCTWHTDLGTEYPPEYNNWLNQKNREGFISEEYTPLSIRSPKDHSVFFYDNNAGEKQKLFVEITYPKGKNVSAKLENNKTGETSTFEINDDFRFTVPVKRGTFTLTVKCENEEQSINYTIE